MVYAKQILLIPAAYMLGCFCTGYYLTRLWAGTDIRDHNSKTTGARNVSRTLGKKGFIFTFVGDFLKGIIAVTLAKGLKVPDWLVISALVAVVVGHIYPLQLGFRGGKGVATTLGALLIYDYLFLISLLAIFTLIFILTRKYIISGLVAILSLPFTALVIEHTAVDVVGIIILTILILWAHRVHIREIILPARQTEIPSNLKNVAK